MKTSKYFFLGLLSLGLVFTGCDDDDDEDPVVTCDAPTGIIVDAVSENSVTLSWQSSESNFTVEYGLQGFELGTGTQVSDTLNVLTIGSLMDNTNYDFYVRTDCASLSSSFAGPVAAVTNEELFCDPPTDLMVTSQDATSATVSWASAGDAFTIEYGVEGFTLGSGTQISPTANPFTVENLATNTIYDFYLRKNCPGISSVFVGPATVTVANPVVGDWEAYDVSGLLAGLGITGISAEFRLDQTYTVISDAAGAETTFEGTYLATLDEANGLYEIVLNQTVPNSLTSEGIFEVYFASPDSMWYEVAQTNPAITGVTPPTTDAGFGSTSGGAFGNTNIQKYSRVE